MQAYNSYLHEIDTVSNHLIIVRPLAYFCIKNMQSYMVAIVRAIYSYNILGKYSPDGHITLCLWLDSIHSHSTYSASQLDPCLVKTNVKFVFGLSDPIFR